MNLRRFFVFKGLFNFGKKSPREKDFGEQGFSKENRRGFIKKSFSKEKLLICLILVFVLAGASFFYYWFFYETPPEKWDEAKYSPPSDYAVRETADGLMIENKKAGLSFKVPEGWRVEKEKYRDYIALLSPGAEEDSFLVKNGCKIKAEVRYIKTSFQTIETVLRDAHSHWEYVDNYELVNINSRQFLKNTTGIASLGQHYISIHEPVKTLFASRVYSLSFNSDFENFENCSQSFEEFLKTVKIR